MIRLMRVLGAAVAFGLCCLLAACYSPPSAATKARPGLSTFAAAPPSPKESRELLAEMGADFAYGSGVGETALHAGAVVMFPPYALVLIGNSVAYLSGHEPIGVSDFLPKGSASAWSTFYSELVSVPGRVAAGLAQEENRSPEVVERRMKRFEHLFAPVPVGPRLPPAT
jgi:hypothetical protein